MKFLILQAFATFAASMSLILSGCNGSGADTPNQEPRETRHSSEQQTQNPPLTGEGRPLATTGGGIDSSGGDATRSTGEQVSAVVNNIRPLLKNMFFRAAQAMVVQVDRTDANLIPQDVQRILHAMLNGNAARPTPLLQLLESTELSIDARGDAPCTDRDYAHKDASASATGQLCFSVSRLTRIPPRDLQVELAALGAHELSHLYGFDEADASRLQQFFATSRKLILPTPAQAAKLNAFYEATHGPLTKIEFTIVNNKSDDGICSALGELVAISRDYFQLGANLQSQLWLPHLVVREIAFFALLADSASTYCDILGSPRTKTSVRKGDRPGLIDTILMLRETQIDIANYFARFVDVTAPPVYHSYNAANGILTLAVYKSSRPLPRIGPSDFGCALRDEKMATTHNNYPTHSFTPPLIYSENGRGTIYNWTYSLNEVGPSGKSNHLSISVGFKNVKLRDGLETGLQLMLIAGANEKNLNKQLEVLAADKVLISYDGDGESKLLNAVLRKDGVHEHFQVRFSIPDHEESSQRRNYTLRCELLKNQKGPHQIRIASGL